MSLIVNSNKTDVNTEFSSIFPAKGSLRSHDVTHVVPTSNRNADWGRIFLFTGLASMIILVASITMWVVGAQTNVVGLEITGKVLFGLTIGIGGSIFLSGGSCVSGFFAFLGCK